MLVHIELKLFATLKKFTPESAARYAVAAGTTIGELLEPLGIPRDLIKLIFVDGKKGTLQDRIKGGERIGIFPPVGGG